jgi:Mlc titration factor MtfA (ptsG expression regulator)
MKWFRDWRRARILARARLDEARFHDTLEKFPFTRALSGPERRRLRDCVVLFLHEKSIEGAAGLEVTDAMRMEIAVQACMIILNLDLDYYAGWSEIIVYPDEFVVDYEYIDEDGVAHAVHGPLSGESWLQGPVVLSWADAASARAGSGYNVVIHEFAHKIDMLNGAANGFPPLHAGMDRGAWSRAFSAAFEDFCARLERGEHTLIDPYAAENPGEFFAVMTETFFDAPHIVLDSYPAVYRQLVGFYRQDPAARLMSAERSRRAAAPLGA